tara:strand:+ start:359 stop:706 length:348 start_codon:yes stop_codon:yes gene_type:complete
MNSRRLHLFLFSLIIILISSIPGNSFSGKFNFGYDKIIHFIEYSFLGYFCLKSKIKLFKSSYFFTMIFGMFFGIFDEFWQSFIPGRNSSIYDVIADFSGICFISFLFKSFSLSKK